jgi:hypothetical protein
LRCISAGEHRYVAQNRTVLCIVVHFRCLVIGCEKATYNTNYKISAGEAKIVGGEAGESHGAKITITYKSKDDLIALDKWDRCYIFDKVLKLGDATWTTEDGGTYKTALDGNYMTKPASSLTLAIYCEEY